MQNSCQKLAQTKYLPDKFQSIEIKAFFEFIEGMKKISFRRRIRKKLVDGQLFVTS